MKSKNCVLSVHLGGGPSWIDALTLGKLGHLFVVQISIRCRYSRVSV